jgi:signal transduction histidine kinase
VDAGHGIPEEDQARIFEKFRTGRGDATGDTGLGLPFCKLAVELMGGRIGVESRPLVETTFWLALPSRER